MFPLVSVALLVITTAGIVWRGRNQRWVRDAQLAVNAQPRLTLVSASFVVLGAAALVIWGVGSLTSGFVPGWGFFPLALQALLLVAFTAWIARRPFPKD